MLNKNLNAMSLDRNRRVLLFDHSIREIRCLAYTKHKKGDLARNTKTYVIKTKDMGVIVTNISDSELMISTTFY